MIRNDRRNRIFAHEKARYTRPHPLKNRRSVTMSSSEVIVASKARLNENPNDAQAAATLGNIYYDMKDAPRAILYYLISLDIDPAQPAVRTDMGTMLWQNGDVGLAEQAFRRVIADHPGFGNAYINLGHLLQQARKDA